jgi:transposase
MTRLHYAADLIDLQWALLEKLLPPPKKTRPVRKMFLRHLTAIQIRD